MAGDTSPSAACVCGRLRRAARALTQLYDDTMAPSGLRVTQFSLMRTLARRGPTRITDLAREALLDRTALSRNLDASCKAALSAVDSYGDRVTGPVAAMMARIREQGRERESSSCAMPARYVNARTSY